MKRQQQRTRRKTVSPDDLLLVHTRLNEIAAKVDRHIIKLGTVCDVVQSLTGEHPCRPGVQATPVPANMFVRSASRLSRWQHFKAIFSRNKEQA